MIRGFDWLVTGIVAVALLGIAAAIWLAPVYRSAPSQCECICGGEP